jgi:hypothetical protein
MAAMPAVETKSRIQDRTSLDLTAATVAIGTQGTEAILNFVQWLKESRTEQRATPRPDAIQVLVQTA